MATTLYPSIQSSSTVGATAAADSTAYTPGELRTSRGSGAATVTATSVTGPTSGVAFFRSFVSDPLDGSYTISGTITFNIRCAEANMAANAGAQVIVEKLDPSGAVTATVVNSEFGTEMSVTTERADNWTATPTSTAFAKGDRIRVRVLANDAGGTMASGHTLTLWYRGPTGGASGDTFITFTENLGFVSTDPAATTVYLTDTSAGINPGSADEKEAWTSRGSATTSAVTNTAAGWTSGIQATATGGGTAVEWYTRALSAFTLAGLVKVNAWASESALPANAGLAFELAVTNGDGTGAVVWARGLFVDVSSATGELSSSIAARTAYLCGPDTAVSAGQRIRIRAFVDDSPDTGPLVTGHTVTMTYAGTSASASGDTYVTFTQTLTENVAATSLLAQRPHRYHLIRR